MDTQIIPRQRCTNIAEKTAVYIPKPQTQTHAYTQNSYTNVQIKQKNGSIYSVKIKFPIHATENNILCHHCLVKSWFMLYFNGIQRPTSSSVNWKGRII